MNDRSHLISSHRRRDEMRYDSSISFILITFEGIITSTIQWCRYSINKQYHTTTKEGTYCFNFTVLTDKQTTFEGTKVYISSSSTVQVSIHTVQYCTRCVYSICIFHFSSSCGFFRSSFISSKKNFPMRCASLISSVSSTMLNPRLPA